jgi:hypothetical protein
VFMLSVFICTSRLFVKITIIGETRAFFKFKTFVSIG